MPLWPLAATLAVQTLATMALYSLPTVAPEVARDLNVNGTLVGSFVAMAYGVGILSALVSPGMVRKYGGVRATQGVLLGAAGMLALAALGSGVTGLALAAIVLGLESVPKVSFGIAQLSQHQPDRRKPYECQSVTV